MQLILSLIFCLLIHIQLKKNTIKLDSIPQAVVANWIVLTILIIGSVISLILIRTIALLIFVPTIALTVWHIKLFKKLSSAKVSIIENSVCYCNDCGTALLPGTTFCTKCGSKIE